MGLKRGRHVRVGDVPPPPALAREASAVGGVTQANSGLHRVGRQLLCALEQHLRRKEGGRTAETRRRKGGRTRKDTEMKKGTERTAQGNRDIGWPTQL